ncbi:MAG: hypothetical protein KTR31_06440 [Myxococcales bacterium]|nr:hypothetical protein [Myxococcales bacterium]
MRPHLAVAAGTGIALALGGGIALAMALVLTGWAVGGALIGPTPTSFEISQSSPRHAQPSTHRPSRAARTTVNGRALTQQEHDFLMARYGQVLPGDFWYDPRSGAFGPVGGPPTGRLDPGLPFAASSGRQWRGEATRGGWDPMTSGTWDPNGNNHVISVDGEVLNLPY